MSFKNIIHKILLLSLLSQPCYAGKTGTWGGSTTHQCFPTITQALLGNGYAVIPSQAFFGDCSDGNLTMAASGTTTLARDMFYNSVSWPVASTANFSIQNQRIFICGTLDLTNAPADAFDANGTAGGNGAAGGGAGTGGAATAAGTNIANNAGGAGGAGAATAGTIGAVGVGGNCVTGETGGSSGAGGAGGGGAGGAGRAAIAVTNAPMRDILYWFLPQNGAGTAYKTTGSGPGGGGGGGDGTSSGGGGGHGGASGATMYISAFKVITGGSTPANVFQANGGVGGNGGSPNGTCTAGCGGGGGGSGGGGGWIVFKYNTKTGSTVTNLFQAAGGSGGTGGTHKNTGGVDGSNGNVTASQAGLIQLLNMATGTITSTIGANASL